MPLKPRFSTRFDTPFKEQAGFFRRKINLPAARWDDIQKAAHDRAFIVAGAAKADLLSDLRRAVEENIRDGRSVDDFRKDFRQIVGRHGWHGWAGEGTEKGEAWRTRVIFETNLRASYAAGRYKQLTDPGLLKRRPYWQYVHSGHSNPRKEHKAWGDAKLTLPHGHPFWETHYPPNGWGCGCTVRAVRAPEEGASSEAPGGWDTPDPKTGEPPGIDKGWGYAPGANTDTSLRQMVQDKLITYPPAIQRALISDIGRQLNVVDRIEDYVDAVCADAARKDDLWLGFVERPERFRDVAKTPLNQFLVLLPPTVARHIKKAHGHDGKDQRMATPADLHLLMRGLNEGEAVPGEYNKGLGHERFIVRWDEGTEQLRAVWEVRQGRHNRAVALISLIVKRKK